jgi:hypothetical protein
MLALRMLWGVYLHCNELFFTVDSLLYIFTLGAPCVIYVVLNKFIVRYEPGVSVCHLSVYMVYVN